MNPLPQPTMRPGWFDLMNPWDHPSLIAAIDRSRSVMPVVPAARRAEDQETSK